MTDHFLLRQHAELLGGLLLARLTPIDPQLGFLASHMGKPNANPETSVLHNAVFT
jgi:hypothetical protein